MKAKKCGYCGSINPPEASRCERCGIKISSAVVSDGYDSEEILSFGARNASAPPGGTPQPGQISSSGSNPMSGGAPEGRARRAGDEPAVAGRRERDPRDIAAAKTDGGTQRAESRLLTRGSRLFAWLLLIATLGAAAFTAKRFGYRGDVEAGLEQLFTISSWDPYWVGTAIGISLAGVLAFVALHLAAAILENLVGLRAELRAVDGGDPPAAIPPGAESSPPERDAVEERPSPPTAQASAQTSADAGSEKTDEKELDPEPPILVETVQLNEEQTDSPLEPGLVDASQGDKRKEPTFDT
jgi:hypothetical protein